MLLGSRFKVLLADTGLSIEAAAKMLHVTPRTIRYWVSGKVLVPYAAYKLVRVMRLFELPCVGWDGWHMHSGKLWSPEGHGFSAHDSNWWGLLVRRSEMFGSLVERDRQIDLLMQRMGPGPSRTTHGADAKRPARAGAGAAPTGEAGRAAQPPGLYLSSRHFGTSGRKTEEPCGLQPDRQNPPIGQRTLTKDQGARP
jgi:hypothetical protein